MKKVLVLGGTGAMGVPLVKKLSSLGFDVDVTSRKNRESACSNVHYIKGNAHNYSFLKELLQIRYDIIVDFMSYKTDEFKLYCNLLCESAKQYIFISSCRVYAECDDLINEDSPRLLDVTQDQEFLNTDEYSLTKARQENILKESDYNNWTIIRPTITYSNTRLQLGVLEKEYWLYRALHGRSIVFSKDILNKITTMTTADDVVDGIVAIIGEKNAFREVFHITSEESYTWKEILDIYLRTIEDNTGKKCNVVLTEKAVSLKNPVQKYQIIYCRYFNRRFDNSKIGKYINVNAFRSPIEGLQESLTRFLENPQFGDIDWKMEAWNDIAAKERTPLKEIPGKRNKLRYLGYRYNIKPIIYFLR